MTIRGRKTRQRRRRREPWDSMVQLLKRLAQSVRRVVESDAQAIAGAWKGDVCGG